LALAPCQEDVHVGMGSKTLNGPKRIIQTALPLRFLGPCH
jgi:hypothetical protein